MLLSENGHIEISLHKEYDLYKYDIKISYRSHPILCLPYLLHGDPQLIRNVLRVLRASAEHSGYCNYLVFTPHSDRTSIANRYYSIQIPYLLQLQLRQKAYLHWMGDTRACRRLPALPTSHPLRLQYKDWWKNNEQLWTWYSPKLRSIQRKNILTESENVSWFFKMDDISVLTISLSYPKRFPLYSPSLLGLLGSLSGRSPHPVTTIVRFPEGMGGRRGL